MPIFQTPVSEPQSAEPDQPEPEPDQRIQYPIGRLGAVTRVRKQIEEYLKNVTPDNLESLKSLFTEYLVKVDNLYQHCESIDNEDIRIWLDHHRVSIEMFRSDVNSILYPPRKTPSICSRVSNSSSTTSSARLRLAEEKAKLAAHKEFSAQRFLLEEEELKVRESLDQEELNLRLRREKVDLELRKAKVLLMNEEAEKRMKNLESELEKIEEEPQTSIREPPPLQTLNLEDAPFLQDEIPPVSSFQPVSSRQSSPQRGVRFSSSPGRSCQTTTRSLPITSHQQPTKSYNYRPTYSNPYPQPLQTPLQQQSSDNERPVAHESEDARISFNPWRNVNHNDGRPLMSTPNNHDFNSKIIEVLQNQTELSRSLITQHEKSSLPKKELDKFDGKNLTDFKLFMDNFEHIIERACNNEKDMMLYLQQYTSGRARRIVDSCVHSNPQIAYRQAKEKLFSEFDNEFKVSNTYLEQLSNWPVIKNEDAKAMEELALFLSKCDNYVSNMSIRNPFQSPNEMLMIVNKLPYKYRERWRSRSHSIIHNFGTISFKNLVDFVNDESSILNSPLFGNITGNQENLRKQLKSKVLATQLEDSKFCEFCKEKSHYINFCKTFGSKTPKEKTEFIFKTKLCFGCLRRNHFTKDCPRRMSCSKCSKDHPTILHDPARVGHDEELQSERLQQPTTKACSIKSNIKNKVIVPIIPVILKINNREKIINCALDTCATDVWMNDKLLKHFKIHPDSCSVNVSTFRNKNYDMTTKVLSNITVTSLSGNTIEKIPVCYTEADESWPFSKDDLFTQADLQNYEYLKSVPLDFIDTDIDLLIGQNMTSIMKPLEVFGDELDKPYAVRHSLGWCVAGPISRTTSQASLINRVSINDSVKLNNKLERLISADFIDTNSHISKCMSIEDKNWLDKISKTVVQLPTNHFQIDLPLKDKVKFPCNRAQVYFKFQGLKKRLCKNEQLYEDYNEFMQTMINCQFAEEIPKSELTKKTGSYWYINHHPVYHKVKKKIRIVFNCSLEFEGISLNANLLQGPDLASSLMGVLLRFRQESIAVVGDITKMYYQVKVPSWHADYLRFFWMDKEGKTIEYRLLVHVFGATSSPSIANYALKQSTKYSDCSELIKSSILSNFYVDDFLKSLPTEIEALSTINNVSKVLSNAGFTLTAYNSNSPEVLEQLPPEDLSKDAMTHELKDGDETRALGVIWLTKKDNFTFKNNLSSCTIITKRNMLKILASVFDPLGLLNPILVHGKRLLQEACRLHTGWDDEVSLEISVLWKDWLLEIQKLDLYEVPRCLKLNKTVEKITMHTFSDGSEKSYGAVCYLSFLYSNEEVSSALVASKSRLTPLNNSTLKTIPRIELAAAKVAVDLAAKLKLELQYTIDNEVYWTDSSTVLKYVNSESGRFQRYVSNKVNYIRNYTNPLHWKYVPSCQNPADIITRGYSTQKLISSQLWNCGPNFLINPKLEPVQLDINHSHLDPQDIELKKEKLVLTSKLVKSDPDPVDILMQSCSHWYNLKRRIAAILMLKSSFKSKSPVKKQISLKDLMGAETYIIKYLQDKYYSDELKCIKNSNNLSKTSSIAQLNPFLDSNNMLRVGGRLSHSSAAYDTKHPVIIPPSFIAELILKDIHINMGHLGKETMIAQLRTRFWLVKAKVQARKVTNNCVNCRKIQAKTGEQFMADLPKQRISGELPSFTNTGTDYFGPFYTKHGRKSEKIYGVVFTCMSSRAIHIELSHSLTTDSFINALRRFVARRGNVRYIVSDNGTNLTGGCTELKDAIARWNESSTIESWMKQREIIWKFNTPNASHFGGFFEREIRSIRKVLNSIMSEQKVKLTFEELNTLMCEVESILNSRPLTCASDDPNDIEPLTPNHLLLLNNFATFPPGLFSNDDIYARKRWKQVQYLSDLFWTRWKREYVVLLQHRQKWNTRRENFAIDDIVLVKDVNLPRNVWPLGRVVSVKYDSDNIVRSCSVKISKCKDACLTGFGTSVIDRPITKLVRLC